VRRGNNEGSPYCIIDREDWQRYNTCLARDPYEAECTLVLGMIYGSSMAVNRYREGKEKKTAQKPNGSNPA